MADLAELGQRMAAAREKKAAVLMLMGAHVLRAGVQRQLIDLMEKGLITHVGMNGAGPIHDYEMSRIGATCESVARYIKSGQFGLWKETGEINDIVKQGAAAGMGLGESIGKAIHESKFPYKDISVLAAGYRMGVPVTAHIGIGYDIIHEHPNFDPAAFGTASYRDFLAVCDTVSKLEGGVFLCFGSAVMGPEVYLKALSMARNVAHQQGRKIVNFTTAAFDLIPIEGEWHDEAPKSNPQYYYRPWKTILVRTVADGGQSFYVCGDHRQTLPHLRAAAVKATPAALSKSTATAQPPAPQPKTVEPPPKGKEQKPAPVAEKLRDRAAEKPRDQAPFQEPPPSKPKEPKPAAKPVAEKPKPAKPQLVPPAAKVEPAPPPPAGRQLTSETIFMRELTDLPERHKAAAAKRKAQRAGTAEVERSAEPPAKKQENAEAAVQRYLQLKEWVRANDATDFEWYEVAPRDSWHHDVISKEGFLRLFYRVVWTANFQPRVVASKEDDYFRILNEILYVKGRFQAKRQSEFLMKVAAILGGSGDNRKNKAIMQVVEQIEADGWDEFRSEHAAPLRGVASRLEALPTCGQKQARHFLYQLGISDPDLGNSGASRFAGRFGYPNFAATIQQLAAATGDTPAMVDFVLWDAGENVDSSGAP